MSINLQPTPLQLQLLSTLNLFITKHQIQLYQFWNTSRLCLTITQFISLLHNINYFLPQQKIEELQENGIQFINLEVVLKGVEYWRGKQESISKFIAKGEESNRNGGLLVNNFSMIDKQASNNKPNKYTLPIRSTNNFYSTNSNHKTTKPTTTTTTIVKNIDRQIIKQTKLNQTLIRAKNESDYQLTIKIGQANDICNTLKNNLSYLIDSSIRRQIIEINSKSGQQKVVSRKEFEKKYEGLKVASFGSKKEVEGNLQEDLKKTLVEVMYISGELEEQINLLLRKGINH